MSPIENDLRPYWRPGLDAARAERTILCAGCNERLPATDEHFSRWPSGKHRNKCKPCRANEERRRVGRDPEKRKASVNAWRKANPEKERARQKKQRLKTRYGLSEADHAAMLAAQDGKCAICDSNDGGGRWGRLVVDHEHETGRVRKLLCHGCNTVLGLMGEDPVRLRRAAEYLEAEIRSDAARKSRVKRASAKQEETPDALGRKAA